MTWKKRIISIALCLCALLCAASVRAEAADEHSHPICGASHKDVGDHTSAPCSNVTWQAWDGTDTIGNDFFKDSNTKYLYLSRDVEMSDKWTDTIVPEGKTLYLCLNGHSLTRKASGYTINVYGTLVLCDCNGSRQGKCVISHGKKDDGSLYGTEGIYVIDNAVFKMYGGKISGNNGGVIVSGGTFTMYGGEISHNTRTTSSAEGGGGVWVKDYKSWSSGQTTLGNFAMYGGTICNNEIQSSVFGGGGVGMDSDGSFYMENGTITGNKCNNSGGGLDIRCTTITIKGNSTISGNTCGGEGGGIFAISSGESSITNCTISGNNATGTNSKVVLNTSDTLTGKISNVVERNDDRQLFLNAHSFSITVLHDFQFSINWVDHNNCASQTNVFSGVLCASDKVPDYDLHAFLDLQELVG